MELIIIVVKVIIIFHVAVMGLASLCTWVERKGSALIQDRVGANRAGRYFDFSLDTVRGWPVVLRPLGAWVTYALALPVAKAIQFLGLIGVINTLLNDAVKALFKEDFVPDGVSNFLHSLAPFLAVFPIFLAFAVVPIGPDFVLFGTTIRPQIAELSVGVLFILSMGSLAVYGVAMAGWTGNNKFSLLGGLRAAAQMISYELALGISIVTLIVIFGTTDLYDMILAQKGSVLNWGLFTMGPLTVLAFIIFFIVGMAETKRGPFDLPESESELVAGYFTEYSGMKFLLFWLGEFAEIGLFALLLVIFFFGGWHIPWVEFPEGSLVGFFVGHVVLMAKVTFFCVLQIVIRWTLPRFRYDQLMNLGWKILLPLSMANLVAVAAWKLWE